MAMDAVCIRIEEERMVQSLQAAGEKLDRAAGEVVLDFSSVRRVDPSGLKAIEEFAVKADGKAVMAVLRGVKVDVYKVLKLVKLASRFSFVN